MSTLTIVTCEGQLSTDKANPFCAVWVLSMGQRTDPVVDAKVKESQTRELLFAIPNYY
jgi:hypothetical protein